MLEAAPAGGQVDEERVPVVGKTAEERALGLDDRLDVRGQALLGLVSPAPQGDLVRLPVDLEREHPVRPALDRAVHELVVIAGAEAEDPVAAPQRLETRGDLP